ncbi:MAG: ComF family protein [Candidatus Omnitrophica bacterium]|nr:ComF family protein [Candidatus Omnitrophota bacterium]
MLRNIITGLTDLIYPKTCLACKTKITTKETKAKAMSDFICSNCRNDIKVNLPPFCLSCGRQLDKRGFSKNTCSQCQRKIFHFDRALSPCTYTGTIKELIHEFKYKNKEYLAGELSKLMINFIKEYRLPIEYIDFIIPIPLHQTRLREREFNQADLLSKHIATEFNKDILPDAIYRARFTNTQTELDHDKRINNVKGCFSLTGKRNLKGRNIMLIDDVLTSGATSSEASRCLKEAGANVVFVLTLAN